MKPSSPSCCFAISRLVLSLGSLASASDPIVTVSAPGDGASLLSPVNYIASATSPDCSGGIVAMRIYSAPFVNAFTGGGGSLNTYISLEPGTYGTVVQAWDACGNVGKAFVTITVTGQAQPAGFVYTVNNAPPQNAPSNIRAFTIVANGNGALAPTLQDPVSANQFPVAVASDKGGFRLYVADYVSGDIFPYFIDRRNGYIYPVPGAPFAANRSVTAVAVHPGGKLVFAALSEYNIGDSIAVFQVQDDGSLVEAPGSPYPTPPGPQALTIDPTGRYLYAAVATGFAPAGVGAYIAAFQIDPGSASLTPLPGSPYKMANTDCGVPYLRDVIDFSGKHLYAAEVVSSTIYGFDIDSTTGMPNLRADSPWPDLGQCQGVGLDIPFLTYNPKSLAIDGTGKFLYALNAGNIAIYSIADDGALNLLKFTPDGSACAGAVRTDPTGNYLYAGACSIGIPVNFQAVVGFSIDHTTGDLTPLPTSPYTYPESLSFLPFGTNLVDIAVTP